MSRRGSAARVSRFAPASAGPAEPLYLPPFRVAALEARAVSREDRQRLAWERLRKQIHGVVNRANAANAADCVVDLLRINVVRGLGLLCRSLLRVQVVSQNFTPVYAAIVAAVNARVPEAGEVLLARLVAQLKRGMDESDRGVCLASVKFIAHLFNQSVVDALLPLEIMNLLASAPSDDSVELLVAFMKECGSLLEEAEPRMLDDLFQLLRRVIQEGEVNTRIQYLVEGLMAVRRNGFRDFVSIPSGLDLIPDEDRIIHSPSFSAEPDTQLGLDAFAFENEWEQAEVRYAIFRSRVLSEDDPLMFEDEENVPVEMSPGGEERPSLEAGGELASKPALSKFSSDAPNIADPPKSRKTTDMTEEELVSFRRKVYLHIVSAASYEECAHKLALYMRDKAGQEAELCNMILECCAQQRTFMKYYALVGKQFCLMNRIYVSKFEEAFAEHYSTMHRFDSRKIRNMANFYAFLLSADALPWSIFGMVVLSKEETTASSRIFLKYLLLEIAQTISVMDMKKKLEDESLAPYVTGLLPSEDPSNIRFAIEYFTAIGLGPLTDGMRERLRSLPSRTSVPAQPLEGRGNGSADGSLSSSSSSLSSSSESSSSESLSSYEDDHSYRDRGLSVQNRSPRREAAAVHEKRLPSSPHGSSPRRLRKYPRRSLEQEDVHSYPRRHTPSLPSSPRHQGRRPPSFPERIGHDGYRTFDRDGGRGRGTRGSLPAYRSTVGAGRGRGRGQGLTIPAWVTQRRGNDNADDRGVGLSSAKRDPASNNQESAAAIAADFGVEQFADAPPAHDRDRSVSPRAKKSRRDFEVTVGGGQFRENSSQGDHVGRDTSFEHSESLRMKSSGLRGQLSVDNHALSGFRNIAQRRESPPRNESSGQRKRQAYEEDVNVRLRDGVSSPVPKESSRQNDFSREQVDGRGVDERTNSNAATRGPDDSIGRPTRGEAKDQDHPHGSDRRQLAMDKLSILRSRIRPRSGR